MLCSICIAFYKENTMNKEIQDLLDQIKILTTERDEARRMYCVAGAKVMYKSDNKSTWEHIANNRNWDCYLLPIASENIKGKM